MIRIIKKVIIPILMIAAMMIFTQSCHDDVDDCDNNNPLIGTVWIHKNYPAENEKYSYNGVPSSDTIAYFTDKHVEEYAIDMNGKIIDRMARYPYGYRSGHLYVGEKDWRHEIQWDHYYLNLFNGMRRCNTQFEDFL